MKVLSRAEILDADDRNITRVSVPEWGGDVFVRTMGGDDRDAWELSNARLRKQAAGDNLASMAGIRARLCAAAMCDENGERLFTLADVLALGRKSGAALDRVFDAARKINGMGDDEVSELGKASGISAPSAGPGSATPSPTAAP